MDSIFVIFGRSRLLQFVSVLAKLMDEESKHTRLATEQVFNFVYWHIVRMIRVLKNTIDEEDGTVAVHDSQQCRESIGVHLVVNNKLCGRLGKFRS